MLDWFLLALLSALILTLINYGDKFVVESQIRDPLALLIFLSWVNLVFGLGFWTALGWPVLPLSDTILLLLAGTPPAFAGYFYFQAVSQEETSRIVVLLQLSPVFTLLLSVLLLDDRLTVMQLLGFGLILLAVIGVTRQRKPDAEGSEMDSADTSIVGLMVLTTLIFAGGFVLSDGLAERLATDFRGLVTVIAYTSMGYWLGGLILTALLGRVRRAFQQQLQQVTGQAIASITLLESLFVLRQFTIFQALVLGPVALVTLVGSLNVFFAIFLGWALTLWRPAIFKEDISRTALVRKGSWALLALAGLGLMNITF